MIYPNAIAVPSSYEISQLTMREHQCIQYLLQGLSNKDIAAELHLSPGTVEAYLDNIKTKLYCKNKIELMIKLTKYDCHKS